MATLVSTSTAEVCLLLVGIAQRSNQLVVDGFSGGGNHEASCPLFEAFVRRHFDADSRPLGSDIHQARTQAKRIT